MKEKGKLFFILSGLPIGIANGLFGSGGGIISVPMLQKAGLRAKSAHASSIAVTLPLSIISAVFYSFKGSLDFMGTLPLIPFGLGGAVVGAMLMKKISPMILKRIFGLILIISGMRLLMA